jgi:hypothetical protein
MSRERFIILSFGFAVPALVTALIALQAPICTEMHVYIPVYLQWTFYPIVGPLLIHRNGFGSSMRFWIIGLPFASIAWGLIYWPSFVHRFIPRIQGVDISDPHFIQFMLLNAMWSLPFAIFGSVVSHAIYKYKKT